MKKIAKVTIALFLSVIFSQAIATKYMYYEVPENFNELKVGDVIVFPDGTEKEIKEDTEGKAKKLEEKREKRIEEERIKFMRD